jgi:hypothetical protein
LDSTLGADLSSHPSDIDFGGLKDRRIKREDERHVTAPEPRRRLVRRRGMIRVRIMDDLSQKVAERGDAEE